MPTKSSRHRRQAYGKVLNFAFSHWRQQPLGIAGLAGAIILSTLADVLTPYYAGQLVNAVASSASADAIAWDAALAAFWLLMALGLGGLVLRHFAWWGMIRVTLRMMTEITESAFARVQRFSSDWHANAFAGSTVRKITRGTGALDLLNDTLLLAMLPSVVMLVGTTVMLGAFWPVMGLVIAIGSIIYVGFTVLLSVYWVAPAASLANQWDTRLGGALADAVTCNAVVKGFGAETSEDRRLQHTVAKWWQRMQRTWERGTYSGTGQFLLLLLLRFGIVAVSLYMWAQGLAEAGDIAFVLTTSFVLQGYLRDVGMHVRNLQRSVNDMEELVELYDQPLDIADNPGALPIVIHEGRIGFETVDFHYGKHATPLYQDLNIAIAPGEKVGLVGHSGSGKTTFVKLIQRLHDVSGGRIMVDGIDIREVTQASLRQQIAIVQQEPILFHRSLAENIAYGKPGASMKEIIAAAELANAHGFIAKLTKGYETMVGERGIKLSGGERQRVAIARAFLSDARILILDEATSSLDSESERLIQEAMERLMEGRTTIVIAHRLSTVRALDRLLVFSHGKVAEEGTHEQLIALEGGIYRQLFERQAMDLVRGMDLSPGLQVAE
ncbi:ABC transporter ATP-binding protein [Devosia sp.]|uniref:ABC transporter ATP-binding protein n=1 Tax=Devosia sp. TaxID=1871048 RepID=UPI003A8D20ED